ncbi:hemicentin-2-like isoform X1 [Amphibalanus amphitrite]|uniref:hemicentin-2-like isoform X1 n=1 Tax=Amphibalanus amphitrite TaxID=1232801 RepID=UPI001C90A00C|nr:hemicentin-2-like isoform X1 [Amphibalanus amphitrite]
MQMIAGFITAGLLVWAAGAQEAATVVDVADGGDAVLRCRFDPALVDPREASFDWSHRSGVWDNVAIEGKSFRKRYRVEFSPSEGRYELHISGASYDGDNGQFACRARRSGSGRVLLAETFNVTVLLRPGAPEVRRPPPLVEGAPAELVCASVGGSPAPELRWYRRGQSSPLPAVLVPGRSRSEPTEARLTLTPRRRDDGEQLECVAWNRAMEAGERLTAAVQLSVQYYPRITVGPSNPLRVEVGRPAEMTCHVDSKPAVGNVRWLRSGAFVNTNGTHRVEAVEPSDAGLYTCSAENSVGQRSAELRLDVLYAPQVTAESERVLGQGDSAQLRCHVDANPPAERVYWLREGDPEFRQDGPVLRLTRVSAGDGGRFTCVAVNRVRSVDMAQAEERSGNASSLVLVRHAPGPAAVLPFEPVGVEGRPLTLTCAASPPGYPEPRYRWWRRDRPDAPLGSEQNLTVTSVQPRHGGHYVCRAENELGGGAAGSAEVRVLRAPRLTGRLERQLSRPTDTTALGVQCAAQGRPRPAVLWLKDGLELQTADGRYDVTIDETERADGAFAVRSTLNFRGWARREDHLTAADRGNYTCRFENAAGAAESTMLLRVRHAPIVYHRYNKAAFDVGQEAALVCQMQAFPAPEFRWWRRAAGELAPMAGVTSTPLGNDVHQSELRLPAVSTADYGEYVCQAQNGEGEHSTVLRLQARGRPEAPTDVRAAELGTSWALLDWTPGFDGGFADTIHHVTLRDERDRERAVDCQSRRPCNVTLLQHHSTYRVRVRATNREGDSAPSEQSQFTTLLDGSQLPTPQRARFAADARQISFHVLTSQLDVLGMLDVRSEEEGEWRRADQHVTIANNRGLVRLDDGLGPVSGVRVRLCLREEPTVCGQTVEAENVPAGALLSAAGGSQVTTIILASVAATAGVALLVLLFICCCRRSSGRSTASSAAAARAKAAAAYTDDPYSRHKVSAGAPPHPYLSAGRLEGLPVGGPPRPVLYESSHSNSGSAGGGSAHSQDSLWQATEPGIGPVEPAGRYPPSYGDYGAAYRELQEAVYRPAEPTHEVGLTRVSGMPDPYGGRAEADGVPQPPSFDESLESGLSTPSSRPRRVIREIIV